VPLEIRQLIRAMSLANPLWGAPRIHGELLRRGINVGQTWVAKYMAEAQEPPSQGWKTFLRVAALAFVNFALIGLSTAVHGRRARPSSACASNVACQSSVSLTGMP
jgi:hypothetical protein